MSDYEDRQKWRHWDEFQERGWDEFTELVATLNDEMLPTRVPVADDWGKYVMAETVKAILRDPELRALMLVLIDETQPTENEILHG